MSKTLVGRMPAGAVDLGGSNKAASVGYPVGAINFAPSYSAAEDAMARSIVRLECEADELRAEAAMLREQARILAQERDEARVMLERKWAEQDPPLVQMMNERDKARDTVLGLRKQRAIARNFGEQMERERDLLRVQAQAGEQLGLALVKTIDQLKAEKAAIFTQLVSLQAGSRRATLDEIAESVRDKYDPEYEREEIEN